MQQICPYGCKNSIGSYRCIDEPSILKSDDSDVEIVTTNIVEPYTTEMSAPVKTCGSGMMLDASNKCIDIDECAEGNTGCEHCENTIGSFGKLTNAIVIRIWSWIYGIDEFIFVNNSFS